MIYDGSGERQHPSCWQVQGGAVTIFPSQCLGLQGAGMRDKWAELISFWVSRDIEGIVAGIAAMSRDDAEKLITELHQFTRLMIEAKEIL